MKRKGWEKKNHSGPRSHIKFSVLQKAECNLLGESHSLSVATYSRFLINATIQIIQNYNLIIQEKIILKDACDSVQLQENVENIISYLTRNSNNSSKVITE